MGAIYGILGEADPAELSAMGARLAHRGEALRESAPTSFCRLGQRLEGLASTAMPALPLVVDGFLDNTPELAAEIGMPEDEPLESLLWHLFQRKGREAAAGLAGQFAIAYWDEAEARLVLVRDRFGARPLYGVRVGERFLFASNFKALLALPEVPARPYRAAIRHLQCTRYPMVEHTLLEGVRPVARGACTLLAPREEEDRVEVFMDDRVRIEAGDGKRHARALRERLLSALRRQVRGFDVLGVQLSGGFDSALVLGGVRAVAPEIPVHTFTAGHGEDDFEIQAAAALARHFDTTHHALIVEPEQVAEHLPSTVWYMEDLFGREEMVQVYLLAHEARKHVRLLLSGYAADMTMAGMPRHRLVHLALHNPALRGPLAGFYYFTQTGLQPRSWLARALVRAYYGRRLFPPPRVLGEDYEPPFDPLRRQGSEPLSRHLADTMREDCGWEAYEGCHASAGLLFNAPFMDPDYIACTFSVPDAFKIRGFRQKIGLRQAGEGLLPAEVLGRRKTLQRLKHDERFADMLDRLAEDLLSPAAVRGRGLFDPAEVERLRRRSAGAPYPTEQAYRLWTLAQTELWCRIFLDARGERPA